MVTELPEEVLRLLIRQSQQLRAVSPEHAEELLEISRGVQDDLETSLRTMAPSTYTTQETRVVLAQVTVVVDELAAKFGIEMSTALEDQARVAAGIGRKSIIDQVAVWAKEFKGSVRRIAPVELAGDLLSDGLLEYYRSSRERYGLDAIRAMRQAMARSVLSGETLVQTADKLQDAMGMPLSRAENIVRTEGSLAMHRRQMEDLNAHVEVAGDGPWEKMTTGPMDSRTGADSRQVEGQRRPLDKPFDSDDHGPFMHNPDRPNDRGTTVFLPADVGDEVRREADRLGV